MSRTMESAGNGEKKTVTEFRTVAREELTMELFSQFRRRQVVDGCLRQEQEQWVVKSDPFVDQWSREDYEFLIKCLKNTLETGGVVFGAFSQGVFKGFASVEGKPVGSKGQYRDLTSLHVSEELRGAGIGRRLFEMAALWAKAQGGKKLYISSHSAVETQRFYQAMGCVDAKELLEEHVAREPLDRQLELVLVHDTTGGERL